MPSSPSSCHDEQESATSTTSHIGAPLSPPANSIERKGDPNAMLVVDVMARGGNGTRLAASRSRDNGQTHSENKNDIISNSSTLSEGTFMGEGNAASIFPMPPSTGRSSESQASRVIPSNESAIGASSLAASKRNTSAPTTLSGLTTSRSHHQETKVLPLSSDLIHDSIKAAVASMGRKPTEPQEKTESDKDSGDEEPRASSTMSIDKLVPSKKPRKKRSPQMKTGQSSGRWTQAEHQAFLEGLKECGREWKKVAMRIPTRTSAQIRSHAQKYFSKLQRDHETAVIPDGFPVYPGMGGCATAAAPGNDGRAMPNSVQQNVERLLANPAAAQREVESTLEALRERYRQLQLRLQQRQDRRRSGRGMCHHQENGQHSVPDESGENAPRQSSLAMQRKRTLADTVEQPQGPNLSSPLNDDDHSSVSSHLSASVASMGNDELIALHVLGGALPRGESSQDLEHMAVRASPASDESVSSCATSANNDQDQRMNGADNHAPKRPRPS